MGENEHPSKSGKSGGLPHERPGYRLTAAGDDPTKGDVTRAARRRFLIRGSIAGPFLLTLSSRPLLADSKNGQPGGNGKGHHGKRTLKLSHNTSRKSGKR